MRRKAISIILVLITLISCISCGIRRDSSTNIGANIDFSDPPVVITYLTIGDKPTNGQTEEVIDRLNKILIKNLNAKLDIYYIGWNDYQKNYNKTLDRDDVDIDLVATSTDWLDMWPNVKRGNFLPLTEEMLKTYCPNTYKNVSKTVWYECSYKGDIYVVPENEYTQWTNQGFIYRKDLLKDSGIEEVKSWEDLTTYLAHVKAKHPTMIPWDADGSNTVIALGYLMSKSDYVPIYEVSNHGIWGAYASDKRTIVSPYYEGQEFVDFAKLMKKWNSMGVWKDDLNTHGDNDEEFFHGESALLQYHTQTFYTEIKPTINATLPDAEPVFYWFGKESGNLLRTSILHGAMAVSKNSKNPERALMVYDYIRNNEECYRLMRFGIEGKQYEVDEKGMLVKPSGYNYDRDSIVTNFWWGRRDEFELLDASYALKEYYALVNEYERYDIEYPWDSVPFSFYITEEELEPVLKVFDEYLPEICYGKYEETAEEEVALFREKLKEAGIEEITSKFQKILNTH